MDFMEELPLGVYHFFGSGPGPCVVVMGGIHGNEKIGVEVVEALKNVLGDEEIRGEIYLIIGNPRAVSEGVRFVDCDLNRLFGGEFGGESCEEKRVGELAPLLAKADYLLDIHSTVKKSVPFVYCGNSERHLLLAKGFGVKYIVTPSVDFKKTGEGLCADNFVDRNGGIGITYECGWQGDDSLIEEALIDVQNFLGSTGVAFWKEDGDGFLNQDLDLPVILKVYERLIAESDDFIFVDEFENFVFAEKGEEIADDGDKKVCVGRDSYVVFPKKEIGKGEMACFLAEESF